MEGESGYLDFGVVRSNTVADEAKRCRQLFYHVDMNGVISLKKWDFASRVIQNGET